MLTPLWASYLVKVYAWRAMLEPETRASWRGCWPRSAATAPASARSAIIVTLTYLWLPYMILPVYAGPRAAPRLAARRLRRPRRPAVADVALDRAARSSCPSLAAGSIFTFSLSLGDYITAKIVGGKVTMLGNVVEQNYVTNLPFAAAMATIPVLIMVVYLLADPAHRRPGQPVGAGDAPHPIRADRPGADRPSSVLAFIYVPARRRGDQLVLLGESLTWPPPGFTTRWWQQAVGDEAIHAALLTSVGLATVATLDRARAGHADRPGGGRYAFFGRDTISLLVVLPIALPGIVTGIALNNVFTRVPRRPDAGRR